MDKTEQRLKRRGKREDNFYVEEEAHRRKRE